MCNDCFSVVQFEGILPTDTDVVVNGGVYPSSDTVDDLVAQNPQFWYEPGISGVKTLTTFVKVTDTDVTISIVRNSTPVTVIAGFVKGRPNDR